MCHIWSRGRHFFPSLPGNRYLNLGSKSDHQAESRGISFGTTLWRHVQRYCAHFLLFMQIMCSGSSLLRKHKFPRTNLFDPFEKLKNDNLNTHLSTEIVVILCMCHWPKLFSLRLEQMWAKFGALNLN